MAEESKKKTRLMIAVKQSMYAFEWTLDKIIGINTNGFEIFILHVEEGSDCPVLGAWTSDENHSNGESAGVDGQDTAEEPKIEFPASDGELDGVDGQDTAKKRKIELTAGVDGQDTAKEPKIELVDSNGETAGVDGQDTAEEPKIELPGSDEESARVDGQETAKKPKIELEYDPQVAWDEGESHLLKYLKQRCKEIGIANEGWTKNGSPEVVIPSEVKRVNPDLLVLGSRNVPRDKKDVDPAVRDYAEHVQCPVLKVKPKA